MCSVPHPCPQVWMGPALSSLQGLGISTRMAAACNGKMSFLDLLSSDPSAENGSKPGAFSRRLGVILASFLKDFFFLKPFTLFVFYSCNSIVGRVGNFSRHVSQRDAVGQWESPFPYIFFFINIPFWLCCLCPRVLTSYACLFFPPFSLGTPRNVSFQWGEVPR